MILLVVGGHLEGIGGRRQRDLYKLLVVVVMLETDLKCWPWRVADLRPHARRSPGSVRSFSGHSSLEHMVLSQGKESGFGVILGPDIRLHVSILRAYLFTHDRKSDSSMCDE